MAAVATLTDLGFSSIAAGVIARRRPVVRLLEKMQADERAVRRLQLLRQRYGAGPVELVIPGRRILVVIDPADVARVLDGAPDPFHPANREKRKTLQWHQPRGVLISRGPIRAERRLVNEAALDTDLPVHRMAPLFAEKIAEEARRIADDAAVRGRLDSSTFTTAWWKLVRRIAFGDAARNDDKITDLLLRLRKAGNWSFAALPHHKRRSQFFERLYAYAESPEPGTLLAALAEVPAGGAVDPVGQVPQWIFAFDAAGMATARALALLATHPDERTRALADAADPDQPALRPFLRACVQESVRLWPTTPTILRDTTADTTWGSGDDQWTVAAGAALMIVTPAFHRDDSLPFAHRFAPDIWLDGTAARYPQLVPFSAGPAVCPGRNLVLFTTSTLLAQLLRALTFELTSSPRPTPDRPLPMTLNQLTLEFAVQPAVRA